MNGTVTLEYRPHLIHCSKCNELVDMQNYMLGYSSYSQCPKCGFQKLISTIDYSDNSLTIPL
jgi:Zn finger protein HypA/HybF involved in hydrogenase expression